MTACFYINNKFIAERTVEDTQAVIDEAYDIMDTNDTNYTLACNGEIKGLKGDEFIEVDLIPVTNEDEVNIDSIPEFYYSREGELRV